MTGLWLISYIVLWIVLLAVTAVLISTLRNLGVVYSMIIQSPGFARSSESRTNLKQGDMLPDARIEAANRDIRMTSSFRGQKTAFAVVSATCEACWLFLRTANQDGPDPLDPSLRNMVIVSLSDPSATADLLERAGGSGDETVLFDPDAAILRNWGITATPAMVVVDEEMRVVRQVFGAIAGADDKLPRPVETHAVNPAGSNGIAMGVHHG